MYYPGQKNCDSRAHVAQARDLSSMHAPMFGLCGCLNVFGQGSKSRERMLIDPWCKSRERMSLDPWCKSRERMSLDHWCKSRERMSLDPWCKSRERMSLDPWCKSRERMSFGPWCKSRVRMSLRNLANLHAQPDQFVFSVLVLFLCHLGFPKSLFNSSCGLFFLFWTRDTAGTCVQLLSYLPNAIAKELTLPLHCCHGEQNVAIDKPKI